MLRKCAASLKSIIPHSLGNGTFWYLKETTHTSIMSNPQEAFDTRFQLGAQEDPTRVGTLLKVTKEAEGWLGGPHAGIDPEESFVEKGRLKWWASCRRFDDAHCFTRWRCTLVKLCEMAKRLTSEQVRRRSTVCIESQREYDWELSFTKWQKACAKKWRLKIAHLGDDPMAGVVSWAEDASPLPFMKWQKMTWHTDGRSRWTSSLRVPLTCRWGGIQAGSLVVVTRQTSGEGWGVIPGGAQWTPSANHKLPCGRGQAKN